MIGGGYVGTEVRFSEFSGPYRSWWHTYDQGNEAYNDGKIRLGMGI